MNKKFAAISVLIGTIIGAGVLGIPYVIMKSGFGIGLLNMFVVAAVVITIFLYLGEISLRTKENHQLTGYAERYLGKKGKYVMFFAFIFEIYTALLAYIIGEGESLSFMFYNTTEHVLYFGIVFWIFLSAMTYFGIKALEEGEEVGITFIIIMIISLVVLYWNKIDINNLTYNIPSNVFLPFGVILFAFLGFSAIPVIERILNRNEDKKNLKGIIIISNLIALGVYILFALIVVGSQGKNTPEIATLALGKPFVLLGMFTMFTSYLSLSIAMIDTLRFDFNFSKLRAWLCTSTLPLMFFIILTLMSKNSFTKVLSISGVVSGGVTGILILFMFKNAKRLGNRKPEYSLPYSKILTWLLIILFAAGAIMELVSLI